MAACLGLGLGELHQWRVRCRVVGLQKERRQIMQIMRGLGES